jgi:hypothetical protein
MKIFNVFMISALALTMFACKGDVKKDLIGTWSLSDADFGTAAEAFAAIPQEQKDMFAAMGMELTVESLEKQMKEGVESMKGIEFVFNADGTSEIKDKDGVNSEKAKWSISEDSKTIVLDNEGQEQKFNIESISSKAMTLSPVEEKEKDEAQMKMKIMFTKK